MVDNGQVEVTLSIADVVLLVEALDSHEYWQLGDDLPRNNGMVFVPGDCVDDVDRYWVGRSPTADQAVLIEQVHRCREAADRLRQAIATP